MSIDPIGFIAGDANLYRYVGNQVVTSIDPSGLVDPDYPGPDPTGRNHKEPPKIVPKDWPPEVVRDAIDLIERAIRNRENHPDFYEEHPDFPGHLERIIREKEWLGKLNRRLKEIEPKPIVETEPRTGIPPIVPPPSWLHKIWPILKTAPGKCLKVLPIFIPDLLLPDDPSPVA